MSVPLYARAAGEGSPSVPDFETMAIMTDLIIARPASFVVMAVGAIAYLPASLFSVITRNDIQPLQDFLLKRPFEYWWKRPLGQFD